jgi:rhodanese-related sulfurtransferase
MRRAEGGSRKTAIKREGCVPGFNGYTEVMMEFEISAQETAGLLAEKKARLIDVREPWEFATAKIDGSELMPMGDVPGRAHQELDPEERIIVVCHHGMRSLNVAVWLRNQGFEQAQSLRGGIDAWSAEIDPNVARY